MKRSFGLYLLVFVLLLCSCGQASVGTASGEGSQQTTWEEQYDLGLRYLSDGNYEEAIIAFTAAIEIDPKRAPAYVGRGDAYSGVGQKLSGQAGDAELPAEAVSSYESAVADYLAALDLDESTAEVYRKAAEAYVTLGNIDAAIEILERGVQLSGGEGLQGYLDELLNSQPEETEGMVTVQGRIIFNPNVYDDLFSQYEEKTPNTMYAVEMFGIRFERPVSFWLDSSEVVLQEAEGGNLDAHFDYKTDLYNARTSTSGPMLGRLMEMTGHFIKRDPPGELIGPEKEMLDSGEFDIYTYHPNGDYIFFVESYQLLE